MPLQARDITRSRYWKFDGGLNLEDPRITAFPGELAGAQNYEIGVRGGYARIKGFERFDGRNRPSAATYWVLNFDAGTTAISEGDVLSNVSSPGSTDPQGEALIDAVVESGSFAGNDAAGYVVLGKVSGAADPSTIADDDTLYVSGGSVATANGAPTGRGASTDANDQTWLRDAIETARADIQAVTGSGRILGVWALSGTVYAFRNNAGGTAAVMWESTTAGWSSVDLGGTLAFTSGGTSEPSVGDTITGDGSTETAVITRIVLTSGSWAGGDAAGTIHYRAKSGAFNSGENFDSNNFTMTGAESDVSLSPSGFYDFINANFTGHAGSRKMYGCDGVNLAFEFDGTSFIQITTGMTTDAPIHIEEHKKHLFLAFANGSLQHSSLGDPHTWSPVTGASELGIGEEIVGLQKLQGDILGVFGRNETYLLLGTNSNNWSLDKYSDRAGAIEWSIQRLWNATYADDRGLTMLKQVQAFGGWDDDTFSQKVQRLITGKLDKITASVICREKNQYRLFFNDNSGLFVTMKGGKAQGIMPVDFGMVVRCACSLEDGSGKERLYFGSDDGYIYEMEAGNNFDGSAIGAFIRTHFNHFGSPELRKRYKKAVLELDATPTAAGSDVTILVTPAYAYDRDEFAAALENSLTIEGGGGFWNVDNWDEFYWTMPGTPKAEAKITGIGENIALTIYSSAIYENPHTIYGVTVNYEPGRLNR